MHSLITDQGQPVPVDTNASKRGSASLPSEKTAVTVNKLRDVQLVSPLNLGNLGAQPVTMTDATENKGIANKQSKLLGSSSLERHPQERSAAPSSEVSLLVAGTQEQRSQALVHSFRGTFDQAKSTQQNTTGVNHEDLGPHADSQGVTLLSTSTKLEVGVNSGTRGWVKVQAELGTNGEVRATLVAETEAARSSLHQAIPLLTDFLHKEQVTVGRLDVQTGGVDSRSSMGESGGRDDGNGSSSDREHPVAKADRDNHLLSQTQPLPTHEGNTELPAVRTKTNWLSVMA